MVQPLQNLENLSDEEWTALRVIYLNGGAQGITEELCRQIVNSIAGWRRKSTDMVLTGLLDRGIVFRRAQNYRQVCFIPDDLLSVIAQMIGNDMCPRLSLPSETPVKQQMPARHLLEDLHRLLAYAYNNEITLTQQGQIFKRHLRALLALLDSGDQEAESQVGRYPEPLGYLMGYVLDRQLLLREEGVLGPSDQLLAWLNRPTDEKLADLFAYWQDRYFYQDLQTFLTVMRSMGQNWVTIRQIGTELESMINPSQRGPFLLRLNHHLATFLAPLGLFELGTASPTDQPESVCRLTATGAVMLSDQQVAPSATPFGVSFVLQPTFEMIAPRPVPDQVLWQLEMMGELVGRTDRTLTYRLSRQSILRAFKKGMDGHTILRFLQAHSATGVPQNVAFDLNAWSQSYGQVYLQSVLLLHCADSLLAQQIKASRRTARFILGELTPTALIVDAARHQELLAALEADGLMPRPSIDQPSSPDATCS